MGLGDAPKGAKIVGRVAVRVIPDAGKFRQDLKLALQRAEQSMSANIAVTADVRPFESELRRVQKEWNGKNLALNLDAKTAGFTTHLKAVLRPRKLNIDLTVTKQSVVKIGTILAALSGARLTGNILKDVGEQLSNLDKNLPKISAIALAIASIGAAGLTSLHGLGGLAVGLTQVLPLALLLPGGLFATAAAVTTLVLAFKGAPRSITSALNAYKSLQSVVSKNFWADAAKPIRSFLTSELPDVKKGFASVATELGKDVGAIAGVLQTAFGGGVLTKVFTDARDGAANALPGVKAFTSAFVSLLTVGASFLPSFGSWVSRIGQDFGNWATGAEASGELQSMIARALKVVGQLGRALHATGSIINGVFGSISDNAVGAFADGLNSIAKTVNGSTFQKALQLIFTGAGVGTSGLATALEPVGRMFSTLAPTLASILATGGKVAGTVFRQIANALALPGFQIGLNDFFDGISQGLLSVLPSLPQLSSLLGSIGSFAGTLAANVGPVLSGALSGLSGALQPFLDYIEQNVIPDLGPALGKAIDGLTPKLADLGAKLGPVLGDLSTLVVDILPPVTAALGAVLDGFNRVGTSSTFTQSSPILQFFDNLGALISSYLGAFNALFDPDYWNIDPTKIDAKFRAGVYGPLLQNVQLLQDNIGNFVGTIVGEFGNGWDQIVAGSKGALNAIAQFSVGMETGLLTGIVGVLNGVIDLLNGFASGVNGLGLPGIKVGKITQLTVPKIAVPKLGDGADVLPRPGGTLAVLAERGRPESVVDTGRMNKMIDAINERLASAGTPSLEGMRLQGTLDLGDGLTGMIDGRIEAAAVVMARNISSGKQRGHF